MPLGCPMAWKKGQGKEKERRKKQRVGGRCRKGSARDEATGRLLRRAIRSSPQKRQGEGGVNTRKTRELAVSNEMSIHHRPIQHVVSLGCPPPQAMYDADCSLSISLSFGSTAGPPLSSPQCGNHFPHPARHRSRYKCRSIQKTT